MTRFYGKYRSFTDVLNTLPAVPSGFTVWQELSGYSPGESCGLFISSVVAETGEIAVVFCPCDICAETPWIIIVTEEGIDSYILNSYPSAHEAFQGAMDARKIAQMIDAPGITYQRQVSVSDISTRGVSNGFQIPVE